MPSSTPGSENLVDVKGEELQTFSNELLTGIGLNASNWEPAPLEPEAWIIHTSAEPDVVPLDVTMGVPEPNPKVFPVFAVAPASWNVPVAVS